MVLRVGGEDLTNAEGAGEGRRNATLCRLAGIHIARGESQEQVEALALAWTGRCSPPLSAYETMRTVEALYRKHEQNNTPSDPNGPNVCVSGVGKEGMISAPTFGVGDNSFPRGEAVNPSPRIIPSFPNSETNNSGGEDGCFVNGKETINFYDSSILSLQPEAYHGLLGRIVRTIEPESEADGAGILLSLLVAFGNAVGSKPRFQVGAETHGTNLFLCLVGDTASGKGQAWSIARWLMLYTDAEWVERCIAYGLSSGEGLVDRLRDDEPEPEAESGKVPSVCNLGVKDKRLLALETEFAKPIAAMRREGNTLSPLLRAAWDGGTLEVLTRGKSKLRASSPHVSIVAHITPDELEQFLSKGTEVVNGFVNRFLWCCVKRQRLLPDGGSIHVLEQFTKPLAQAIAGAKKIEIINRSAEASTLWREVYPALTECKPGAFGKAVERARPQVMRLALLYALVDCSSRIEVCHLNAALAVWCYCAASARRVFEAFGVNKTVTSPPTPEPLPVRLMNAIIASPGIMRSDILRDFRLHKAEEIGEILRRLKEHGLASCREQQSEGGGRPAECWYPA